MELSEERSAHKISKRNEDKNRMESEKLAIEMARQVQNLFIFLLLDEYVINVVVCF